MKFTLLTILALVCVAYAIDADHKNNTKNKHKVDEKYGDITVHI